MAMNSQFYYKNIGQDLQICITSGWTEKGTLNVFIRNSNLDTVMDLGVLKADRANEIFTTVNSVEDLKKI